MALPIGFGQTISQPYIVAKITEALFASGSMERVLEIGTGCGYQTAVLAQLCKSVYTVERIRPLMEKAKKNLKLLGRRNIEFKHDDGCFGWSENGPYDAIITTAAPRSIPTEFIQQLADGGRLVIPVGGDDTQQLTLVTRQGDDFTTQILEDVRFVPLLVGQVHH